MSESGGGGVRHMHTYCMFGGRGGPVGECVRVGGGSDHEAHAHILYVGGEGWACG